MIKIKSDIKILFIGTFKSPFIVNNYELLSEHYNITALNIDIVQNYRDGIFYYLEWLFTNIHNIWKYDVIYIWFADVHALPIILVSKFLKKRTILVVGGGEVVGYKEINYGFQLQKIRGYIARLSLKHADIILIPSKEYKNIIKDLIPESNVCVIPNTIDKYIWDIELSKKYDRVVTSFMALKFASILKGIPTFKSAVELLPYESAIYEALPHDILIKKLCESKVYCQLSYTESFGVTLLEAMACGCVPVVTNCETLVDMIGDTGLSVPYGDIKATSNAISKAMHMDGNKARERSKLYSPDKVLKLLLDVIENGYSDAPLVSVVIPSYNSSQWLTETIESVINQSYKNIEIILVDDCSADNTYEIALKYNLKYIKNSVNQGECISSGIGFDIANGKYICRLSSDDVYVNKDKIKHQVDIMERTNVDWSYNSTNISGENIQTANLIRSFWAPVPTRYAHEILQAFDNIILKFPYISFLRLLFGNPVNSSTLMFRRSSYLKSDGWASQKCRTDCDGRLLYYLFLHRFTCVAINEIGVFYRLHPNQTTNTSTTYLNDMRKNKIEAINKVINGNYPSWLKIIVNIIRRKI